MEPIDNKEKILNKKIELDSYILINEINDFELIDKLILDVKEGIKTSTISGKTNVKGEHTEFNYLSTKPNFHEFLKLIQPSIYKIYKKNFIIRDVWGNIYSKEEHYAQRHSHGECSAFCGLLYCTDGPGPGTYFNQYDLLIPEKKGRFVLFDPILYHEVNHFKYLQDRITIAFNFMETKSFVDYSNVYFIKNNTKIIL
jgi:hypothetical protein